jgi:hypothetical protein
MIHASAIIINLAFHLLSGNAIIRQAYTVFRPRAGVSKCFAVTAFAGQKRRVPAFCQLLAFLDMVSWD